MAIEIQWRPETAKVSDLKLWEQNPRKIGKKEYERLKNRIQKRGFHDVIKVNTDMTILSGNQRRRALEELGVETVTILKPERALTGEEMQSVALESNLGDGSWDWDELANFDHELLRDVGFEDKDLAKYFQLDVTEDEAPEPRPDPNVKLGDLFQLGNHRLLCGDATKKDDVERLMDGQKADMVFTDPPYGVNYQEKAIRNGHTGSDATISGDGDVEAASEVYGEAFKRIDEVLNDGAGYYVCAPQGGDQEMMMMMMRATIPCRHQLIWKKDSPVFSMGRLDYDYQHEPILYGWKGSHNFVGSGSFKTSVWEIPRPKASKLHPTMKPIELIANALANSTTEGQNVIDLFGGSGSTIIACEKLNRKCYMMEIDPHYTRVIIDRWEKLTGRKAILSEK